MSNRRLYLHTLGCEKNEADSSGMRALLSQSGYTIVDSIDEADAAVINTCGFIAPAIEESVSAIVEAADLRASGALERLIVTGCLVSRSYAELKQEIPEVDVFLGTAAYHKIVRAVEGSQVDKPAPGHYLFESPATADAGTSFQWLKIGEGCSRDCSFCTIPSFRGPQRSRSPEAVLEQLRTLAEAGVQEAILVSQDSTQYGNDLDEDVNLLRLLTKIEEADGMPPWVRLHYTYPGKQLEQVVPFLAQASRVCSYLDIPIQHSDPGILKAMRRPYQRAQTVERLMDWRQRYPDLWMRSTVIVGHPGETFDTIDTLIEDLEQIGFDYLSLFPWSPEPETHAARMQPSMAENQIAEALSEVSNAQSAITANRLAGRIGSTLEVLVDEVAPDVGQAGGEVWVARTRGQSPGVDGITIVQGAGITAGQRIQVRIEDATETDLFAVPAQRKGIAGIPILSA